MNANNQHPENIYLNYLDASPAPAWISDETGKMIFINRFAIRLWRLPQNYQDKSIIELFPKHAAEQFIYTDNLVLNTNKPIDIVVPSIKLNGTKGYYMLHKFLVPVNHPCRLIAGQAIDITDEKSLEEKLRHQKIQEQKNISRIIIATQELERNELAYQLQDNVNQVLATATVLLGHARKLNDADKDKCIEKSQGYIFKAIEDLRLISGHLNTTIISDIGIIDAVSDIVDNLKLITTDVQCYISNTIEENLAKSKKQLIYRTIQLQANNIIAHSECTSVIIKIIEVENLLFLTISDNGKGCNLSAPSKGRGLSTIRNTVDAFNGDMEIITSPGNGFTLKICLPLESSNIYTEPLSNNYSSPY